MRLTARERSASDRYPHPFTEPGRQLIMPVNEGISYPADDATLDAMYYHSLRRPRPVHGLVRARPTDSAGVMTIVETPDDAGGRSARGATACCTLAPEWEPQKGQFGRRGGSATSFFDQGGYVAMGKRYRAARPADRPAQDAGRETEGESRTSTCWSARSTSGAGTGTRWPSAARCRPPGIDRILWSNRGTPETSAAAERHWACSPAATTSTRT